VSSSKASFQVLFLGLSLPTDMQGRGTSFRRILITTAVLLLFLPLGTVLAIPVAAFPGTVVEGFLAFGLMALLYLVTEELLVEAHEKPDTPLITGMFFVGFLSIVLLDQMLG
jgi:ZIP family zinc transporter